MTDIFRIIPRRVLWKCTPPQADVEWMRFVTSFGPSCFQRDNEWLFIEGELMCHAKTPDGYERIN